MGEVAPGSESDDRFIEFLMPFFLYSITPYVAEGAIMYDVDQLDHVVPVEHGTL